MIFLCILPFSSHTLVQFTSRNSFHHAVCSGSVSVRHDLHVEVGMKGVSILSSLQNCPVGVPGGFRRYLIMVLKYAKSGSNHTVNDVFVLLILPYSSS